eukprot:gene8045-1279_t
MLEPHEIQWEAEHASTPTKLDLGLQPAGLVSAADVGNQDSMSVGSSVPDDLALEALEQLERQMADSAKEEVTGRADVCPELHLDVSPAVHANVRIVVQKTAKRSLTCACTDSDEPLKDSAADSHAGRRISTAANHHQPDSATDFRAGPRLSTAANHHQPDSTTDSQAGPRLSTAANHHQPDSATDFQADAGLSTAANHRQPGAFWARYLQASGSIHPPQQIEVVRGQEGDQARSSQNLQASASMLPLHKLEVAGGLAEGQAGSTQNLQASASMHPPQKMEIVIGQAGGHACSTQNLHASASTYPSQQVEVVGSRQAGGHACSTQNVHASASTYPSQQVEVVGSRQAGGHVCSTRNLQASASMQPAPIVEAVSGQAEDMTCSSQHTLRGADKKKAPRVKAGAQESGFGASNDSHGQFSPSVNRLIHIFDLLVEVYRWLTSTHVLLTWRTLQSVLCGDIGADCPPPRPQLEDLLLMAEICPGVVCLRERQGLPQVPAALRALGLADNGRMGEGGAVPAPGGRTAVVPAPWDAVPAPGCRTAVVPAPWGAVPAPGCRTAAVPALWGAVPAADFGGGGGFVLDNDELGGKASGSRTESAGKVEGGSARKESVGTGDCDYADLLVVDLVDLARPKKGADQLGARFLAAIKEAIAQMKRRHDAANLGSVFAPESLTIHKLRDAALCVQPLGQRPESAVAAEEDLLAGPYPKGAPRPPRVLKKVAGCKSTEPLGTEPLLEHMQELEWYEQQLCHVERTGIRQPVYATPSAPLSEPSVRALHAKGIDNLFCHQAEAIDNVLSGHHTVVTTSTASGKSLCYALPVIEALHTDPSASALFMFPTKALAQDQKGSLRQLVASAFGREKSDAVQLYDGDTPMEEREVIRSTAQLLITNPDMLHCSFLPKHADFRHFLSKLKIIVVDEGHSYGGRAFGWVIPRWSMPAACAGPLLILGLLPTFVVVKKGAHHRETGTRATPSRAWGLDGMKILHISKNGSPAWPKALRLVKTTRLKG